MDTSRAVVGNDHWSNCFGYNLLWTFYPNCICDAFVWSRRTMFEDQQRKQLLVSTAYSYRFRIFQEPILRRNNTMEFLKELWVFLRVRKKLWLAPIIVIMVGLGWLLVLAKGSLVAPFIYTLF